MALTSWKSFDFFSATQITPPSTPDTASIFAASAITAITSGSDSLFLASPDGDIRILSRGFRVQKCWQAHDVGVITHMRQIEGTSLLVTIAEDLPREPILKVWALDKLVKKTGLPTCTSSLSIQNGRKPFPISAFAALGDLSQLAVGFANGAVTVVRGDLIHDRGTRQKTVFESEEPVTGVEFRDVARLTTLYVSTTARLLKLVISGQGQGQPARTIEDAGCGVGCMTVDERNGDVVVVRDDAIYYYGIDGRGPCFAYDGPKSLVQCHEEYLAIITPPVTTSNAKASTLRRFGGSQAEELFNTSTFTVLDTELQIVAHSESMVSQIQTLLNLWGDLYALTLEGKILRYHEKTLEQRLEIFYQRNLFIYAINLAQKSGMDAQQQNVIFRKYGEHLYQKGDYDGAMQQYLKAIDSTEPSQVIRKYLDSQRIHNLIEYLEELHEHHKATADHTTLLLNCYAKLKDIDKLEKFIKSPGDLKFDLDTAISMCRQGGYYDQAAYLATKHGEHEIVVDILIEDSKKYSEALKYICRLDPESAYPNLMKYARVLLENCPKDTTKVFIDYYTGKYQPVLEVVPTETPPPEAGYAQNAAQAVQGLANRIPVPFRNAPAATPATQVDINPAINDVINLGDGSSTPTFPTYTPPRPRTAFSSFVDHSNDFITFLEACLAQPSVPESDKVDLYTTLFEMYLHKANEDSGHSREEWEAKAKTLIEGKDIPIDTSNVLLLSHLADFKDGSILVREQAGLRFDIFRSYTSAKDTRGAIKALRKYGPDEPALYPAALAYFTSDSRILKEAGSELDAVLKKIDDDGLMAPLQVIQTLSANSVATMGLIKPYLQKTIERERRDIDSNNRIITSYKAETSTKRREIEELNTQPVVFQATRCSRCGSPLDPPMVHFLCKHSFHQLCLNVPNEEEGEKWECPTCRPGNETIRAIVRAQGEMAGKHEVFRDALERSGDRFGTVSEFFGRGVLGVPGAE
ncbi:hypothetical protein VE02_00048 [Pseudogymnoascus sp. 03VT05]|nr:hypothetical protein VE02_00048 [Pseudogymnoascus sp. 03VT05]